MKLTRKIAVISLLSMWISIHVHAQSFLLVKDEAIAEIVPKNAKIEKLADGFMFTEGPVWSPNGFLLFTDIPANKVIKWDPEEGISTYFEPTGNANGLAFDKSGRLIMCQHYKRMVSYIEEDRVMPIVTNYQGSRFNSPNDLTISKLGVIYFTDPAWGLEEQENDPSKDLSYQGIFMIKNNRATMIESSLTSPNGIALSPDNKFLYVSNLEKGVNIKTWWRFKVNEDGTIKGKKKFADLSNSLEIGSPDGMKVDVEGNLYCTGPGGIWIMNPKGKILGLLRFPEVTSNCAFGGKDYKTLFVTANTGLYKIDLSIAGHINKINAKN